MPKLLRAARAAKYLGVGRDCFKSLELPYRLVNGQKMWSVDYLDRWSNRQDNLCKSTNEKAQTSGAIPSQSEELGFAEVLELTTRLKLVK